MKASIHFTQIIEQQLNYERFGPAQTSEFFNPVERCLKSPVFYSSHKDNSLFVNDVKPEKCCHFLTEEMQFSISGFFLPLLTVPSVVAAHIQSSLG